MDCDDDNASLWYLDGSSADCPGVSCRQILDDGFAQGDGTYWINPDDGAAPFQAWCDMDVNSDGGGWTLIAMIHYAGHNNVVEPQTWYQDGNNVIDKLWTNQFQTNQQPSAFGAELFVPLLGPGSIARIEAHQTQGPSQVRTVYRDVATSASFRNWWLQTAGASQVCEDLDLTDGCESMAYIGDDGGGTTDTYTPVGLCSQPVPDFSQPLCWITRFNGDDQIHASGVAVNSWTGYWTTWGNGLKIWLRE
jgi:hypothetical protein